MKQFPILLDPITASIIILDIRDRHPLRLRQSYSPTHNTIIRQQAHDHPRVRLDRDKLHPETQQHLRDPVSPFIHTRLHQPRHKRVDADALAGKRHPRGPEQAPGAELGPAVDDAPRQRDVGLGAQDEQDAARRGPWRGGGGHVQLGQLEGKHGALGVDVDGPGVRLGRVVVEVRHAGVVACEEGLVHNAGVDDDVVEGRGRGLAAWREADGGLEGADLVGPLPHVAVDELNIFAERGREILAFGVVDVGDGDVRAGCGALRGDLCAEPLGPAGHQDSAVSQRCGVRIGSEGSRGNGS